jgi:hypothetical protein
MALWVALFVGLWLTDSPAFIVVMGVLACALCAVLALDWHGVAVWTYNSLGWERKRSTLRDVRLVGAVGSVIAAAVTVLGFVALLR